MDFHAAKWGGVALVRTPVRSESRSPVLARQLWPVRAGSDLKARSGNRRLRRRRSRYASVCALIQNKEQLSPIFLCAGRARAALDFRAEGKPRRWRERGRELAALQAERGGTGCGI